MRERQGGHAMARKAWIAAAAFASLLAFAPAAVALPIDGIHNIQHVVVIMQENRSFDQYFGTYPGANGIPAGVCNPDPANGGCQKPFHNPADRNYGGPHGHTAFTADVNGGSMNGYVASVEEQKCKAGEPTCAPACTENEKKACIDVMGYHDAREIPNYWTYAQNYVLQDGMYASGASWSTPEHLYMVSGWSAVCPDGDTNPLDCVGTLAADRPGQTTYPWTDITYQLNKAKVSWRYYLYEGNEPDCASDESIVCKPVTQGPTTPGIWNPLRSFTTVKQDNQLGNIQSLTHFYKDVGQQRTCGLSNVSWVVPNKEVSEHPTGTLSAGQAYVTTLVNTIMRSPCWNNTAIFLSWDDWGGFYDHVLPPVIDGNGYGIRVPGLVISPYAKTGLIDHQTLSHDAYLKFIQDDFLNKARLNPATDGRPDGRKIVREEVPALGDLANDFNFSQTPRAPLLLSPHPPPGPASKPPA
jgi:phospholipase C